MSEPEHTMQEIIERLMNVLAAFQNRLNVVEQKIDALSARAGQQDIDRARFDLWHNGRMLAHTSRIYPKSRSVIFLGANFFGENIKYAYLEFLKIAAQHNVACHFLPASRELHAFLTAHGLPCLPEPSDWSLEHYYTLLRAKVVVAYDHFTPGSWSLPLPYFLLQGARMIQLWHGIPMKQIALFGSVAPDGKDLKAASVGPADVLVGPGKKLKDEWARWVAYREFAALGYPRNDMLLRAPDARELLNVDQDLWRDLQDARKAGRKVIFYAPTFRDRMGIEWLAQAGIDRFARWCEEQGHLFFAKLHPIDHNTEHLARVLPGVRCAPPLSDIYPLLAHTDLLLTDYSSLAFDYLLLDRPIIYYRPDHAAYIAQCRTMRPDYERLTTGPVAESFEMLCRVVAETFSGKDEYAKVRRTLSRELFDHHDAKAGARVAKLILKQLDKPQVMPDGWAP